MTNKQPKLYAPSEKDLRENPMIGGSKGATMAGASAAARADAVGANPRDGDGDN